MNAFVLDCIERKSKNDKVFYSVLVKWTDSEGREHRHEFITFEQFEYGDSCAMNITTRYDKNTGTDKICVTLVR